MGSTTSRFGSGFTPGTSATLQLQQFKSCGKYKLESNAYIWASSTKSSKTVVSHIVAGWHVNTCQFWTMTCQGVARVVGQSWARSWKVMLTRPSSGPLIGQYFDWIKYQASAERRRRKKELRIHFLFAINCCHIILKDNQSIKSISIKSIKWLQY